MLLNTFPFLVFFIVVFVLYWKLPKKFQWVVLLFSSYYFYASWKPAYLGLILVTTVMNYFFAIAINRTVEHKKRNLIFALLTNLGTLFVFKYFNFFTITLDQLFKIFHWPLILPQFKLLLPIGISFYTFQVIGYMVDVYRGVLKPEKHIGFFALFVCFFPQLAAGPIERGKELLPQIKKTHAFDYVRVVNGLKLFTFGLFKKMVIADNLAVVVDHVFSSLPEFKGFSLILAVFIFSWQIYMDFSGYTDMARGVAKMLGFHLVENFQTPYLATSVQNFWQRWHMSLSRWLRDYLYIPLGGNRKGLSRTYLNVLIVFTLCGLWHGAGLPFIVWGMFHGFLMVAERIVGKVIPIKIPKVIQILYTYSVICISWIFFRASTMTDVLYIFRYAFVGFKNFIHPAYLWASISQVFITNKVEIIIIGVLLLLAILIEIIPRVSVITIVKKQSTVMRFALYILLILMIIHLRNANIKEFIYVRF